MGLTKTENIKTYSTKYNINYILNDILAVRMTHNFISNYPISQKGVCTKLKFRNKLNFDYFISYDGEFFKHLSYTNTTSPFTENEFSFKLKRKLREYFYEVENCDNPEFIDEKKCITYLSPILKVEKVNLMNHPTNFNPKEYGYLIQILGACKKDAIVQCYLLKMDKKNKIIAHKELFITGEIIEW